MAAKDRLIVGLDVPNISEATEIVKKLGPSISHYKIGYQLVFAGGLELPANSPATARRSFST